MVRNSTKALLFGTLAAAGIAGMRRYLARHRHPEEVDIALPSTTDPLLHRPLYADPGQRPLVDEPPDEDMDESLPLGLA